MLINGFQKLTVLDYPGKVACIVFTPGCNFRCPFCHNAALVTHIDKDAFIDVGEVLSYLKKRQGILDGVVITGGEPLLQDGIEEFIGKIKDLGYAIKLDTNGSFPEKLISLVEKGLVDYVAMDIKNSKAKYMATIGIDSIDLASIEKSVDFLLQNKVPYEFRTTLVDEFHKKQDIVEISNLIKGANVLYLQHFINSDNCIRKDLHEVPKEKALEYKSFLETFINNVYLRGY